MSGHTCGQVGLCTHLSICACRCACGTEVCACICICLIDLEFRLWNAEGGDSRGREDSGLGLPEGRAVGEGES